MTAKNPVLTLGNELWLDGPDAIRRCSRDRQPDRRGRVRDEPQPAASIPKATELFSGKSTTVLEKVTPPRLAGTDMLLGFGTYRDSMPALYRPHCALLSPRVMVGTSPQLSRTSPGTLSLFSPGPTAQAVLEALRARAAEESRVQAARRSTRGRHQSGERRAQSQGARDAARRGRPDDGSPDSSSSTPCRRRSNRRSIGTASYWSTRRSATGRWWITPSSRPTQAATFPCRRERLDLVDACRPRPQPPHREDCDRLPGRLHQSGHSSVAEHRGRYGDSVITIVDNGQMAFLNAGKDILRSERPHR